VLRHIFHQCNAQFWRAHQQAGKFAARNADIAYQRSRFGKCIVTRAIACADMPEQLPGFDNAQRQCTSFTGSQVQADSAR
jgi:hypothetical protein